MKGVMKLESTREWDIAEQAYCHGQSQGMLNILRQFLNDKLDKEEVITLINSIDIKMDEDIHIGDEVYLKDDVDKRGYIVNVCGGKFFVSFFDDSEYDDLYHPSELVRDNNKENEW